MFDCEIIIAPFQMIPPERDLHKLTHHQINVIINQIEKMVMERQEKESKESNTNSCNSRQNSTTTNRLTKMSWMQQSAYIDHYQYHKSIDKQHSINRNPSHKLIGNNKINQLSIQTIQNPHNILSHIPPKYPSTTKNTNTNNKNNNKNYLQQKSQLKQTKFNKTTNYNLNTMYKNQQQQNQYNYNYNYNQQQDNNSLQKYKSSSKREYFTKNQRVKTFETEYIHNNNKTTSQQQQHQQYQQHQQQHQIQQKQKQALLILKCGLKLLQMIPKNKLQQKTSRQISHLTQLLQSDQYFSTELIKENLILSNITNKNNKSIRTNRTPLTQSNSKFINVLDKDQQYQIKNKNIFQSKQKKKIQITLLSHPVSLKQSTIK